MIKKLLMWIVVFSFMVSVTLGLTTDSWDSAGYSFNKTVESGIFDDCDEIDYNIYNASALLRYTTSGGMCQSECSSGNGHYVYGNANKTQSLANGLIVKVSYYEVGNFSNDGNSYFSFTNQTPRWGYTTDAGPPISYYMSVGPGRSNFNHEAHFTVSTGTTYSTGARSWEPLHYTADYNTIYYNWQDGERLSQINGDYSYNTDELYFFSASISSCTGDYDVIHDNLRVYSYPNSSLVNFTIETEGVGVENYNVSFHITEDYSLIDSVLTDSNGLAQLNLSKGAAPDPTSFPHNITVVITSAGVVVLNETVNGTETRGIYPGDAFLYEAEPAGPLQDSLTLDSPANNTRNNTFTRNYYYTPIFNATALKCDFYTNETGSLTIEQTNTSAVINNSLNYFTHTLPGPGVYDWGVICTYENGAPSTDICYQEFANNKDCGQTENGTYETVGSWIYPERLSDGSYTTAGASTSGVSSINITYYLPDNFLNILSYQIRHAESDGGYETVNYTNLDVCTNDRNTFIVTWNSVIYPNGSYGSSAYCWNQTGVGKYIYNNTFGAAVAFRNVFEEAVFWNINNTVIYGSVGDDSIFTVTIDDVSPLLTINSPPAYSYGTNQDSFLIDLYCTDEYVYQSGYNITNSTGSEFNSGENTTLSGQVNTYQELLSLSPYTDGLYNVALSCSDAHTDKAWNPKKKEKKVPRGLELDFNGDKVTIEVDKVKGKAGKKSQYKSMKTIKKTDRYILDLEFTEEVEEFEYIITGSKVVVYDSHFSGHLIIDDALWFDVEPLTAENIQIVGNQAKIKVKGNNKKKLRSESVGGLNVVTYNYTLLVDSTPPQFSNMVINDSDVIQPDQILHSVVINDDNPSYYRLAWGVKGSEENLSLEYGYCFQEQANEYSGCGGLNQGSYSNNALFTGNEASYAYDSNYSTYSEPSGIPVFSSGLINYTYQKPHFYGNNNTWQLYTPNGYHNFSIPTACMDYNDSHIVLGTSQNPLANDIDFLCYNSSDNAIVLGETLGTDLIYEEGVYWNITATYSDGENISFIRQVTTLDEYCFTAWATDITGNVNTSNQYCYNVSPFFVQINIYEESTGSPIYDNITIIFIGDSGETTFYTNTSTLLTDLNDSGEYNVQFSGAEYATRTYTINVGNVSTTYLNAYLTQNQSTTLFTITDRDTMQVLEDVLLTMYRSINGTWQPIESKYSDITGRVQITYEPDVNYRFLLSKAGYDAYIFYLDPILFSSYDIEMSQTTLINYSQDYDGVSVIWDPTSFPNNEATDFDIIFASPNGLLTAYGVTLSYPGGSASDSGNNALGGQLSLIVDIVNATSLDYVEMTYYYTTATHGQRNYSFNIPINVKDYNNTFMDNKDKTYGLGIFERILVFTIIVIFVVGIASLVGSPIAGFALGLAVMFFMVYIGFVPIWLILPSAIVGLFFLMWKSGGF